MGRQRRRAALDRRDLCRIPQAREPRRARRRHGRERKIPQNRRSEFAPLLIRATPRPLEMIRVGRQPPKKCEPRAVQTIETATITLGAQASADEVTQLPCGPAAPSSRHAVLAPKLYRRLARNRQNGLRSWLQSISRLDARGRSRRAALPARCSSHASVPIMNSTKSKIVWLAAAYMSCQGVRRLSRSWGRRIVRIWPTARRRSMPRTCPYARSRTHCQSVLRGNHAGDTARCWGSGARSAIYHSASGRGDESTITRAYEAGKGSTPAPLPARSLERASTHFTAHVLETHHAAGEAGFGEKLMAKPRRRELIKASRHLRRHGARC